MLAEQRHQIILQQLEQSGSLRVTELAETLGVSAVTLRHDVRELAGRGLLKRVHGGAIALDALTRRSAADERAGSGERFVLGMLVPRMGYYFHEVIRGAQDAARELGVRIAVAFSRQDVQEDRRQLAQLQKSGVDGLLLSPWQHPLIAPDTADWVNELDMPVVLVERLAGLSTRAEQVASDHARGAYDATIHLAALGHERIGLLSQDTATHPRLAAGYEEALRDRGLVPPAMHIVPREEADDSVAVDAHTSRYLDFIEAEGITAVLVHNDRIAISLVRSALGRDVSVPGDLAVVSYDDEVASLADIPLTAVSPPKAAVGATAVRLLVDRLDGSDRPDESVLLHPRLIVRESCGAMTESTAS